MTALGGAGFETGKVAAVSTSIEMPVPVEWLVYQRKKSITHSIGNLRAVRAVGFCERTRRAAADGRF